MEKIRIPLRYKQRIVLQFKSANNVNYLFNNIKHNFPNNRQKDFILRTLPDIVETFANTFGYIYDFADSDSVAIRGFNSASGNIKSEISRLNRQFYIYCMKLSKNLHTLNKKAEYEYDDEPYHMRMFIADSLRPPGLEHLNGPGPLYEIKEDQRSFSRHYLSDNDEPWDIGRHNRTAEEALSEYFGGDNRIGTALGFTEFGGDKNLNQNWKKNNETRFMRYETIPFWQMGGHEGYELDIEDTLGQAPIELGGHVRRWDGLERMINKNGMKYRRYGPTSSYNS
jgi:hypothetical protein